MRHVVKEYNVYRFDELSDDARERAIEDFRNEKYEYDWQEENRDTIHAIAEYMGMKCDYSVSPYCYSYVDFLGDIDCGNVKNVRAYKWILNNWILPLNNKCCPFTGYCLDEDFYRAFDIFRDRIRKGEALDVEDFVSILEDTLCHSIIADMEYQDSDEYIIDAIMANDYEFMEDGQRA